MNEDELGEALRGLLREADPVPGAALEAARAALGWRDIDAELMLLTAEPDQELAHLRGAAPRLLTFSSGPATVELEVAADDGTARLLGQIDPPQEAGVVVESSAGDPVTLAADPQGRFSLAGLPDGWLRVVVTLADGTRTATEWFRA